MWRAPVANRLRDWLALTGVPPAAGLDADLAALGAALAAPGPFSALIHGDPCPGNWLYSGDRLRLLDFEFARFGPALLDGVNGRMHFPDCENVARIPDPLVRRMEDAYRNALIPGCPRRRR